MFRHNFLTYGGQIIIKTFLEIAYFPIWWYSVGLVETAKKLWAFLFNQEKALGFRIWCKNILVPMYGQYDWAGRLISFFIRLIQIIFRGLVLVFWFLIALVGFSLWIVVPIFLFIALMFQIRF